MQVGGTYIYHRSPRWNNGSSVVVQHRWKNGSLVGVFNGWCTGGVLGHIILQKVNGTATNHYTQTSNHRCPLKLCCVSCPMMHSQRRAKCESLLDLLLTRERHSAFSVSDMWQNFRVYAKVFKTFFLLWMSFEALYSLAEYNIKLCHLQTKNPIPWHLS